MTTATLNRPDAKPKISPRFIEAALRDANHREMLTIAREDGLTEWVEVFENWIEVGVRVLAKSGGAK